jgi:hypothetical protein
MFVWSDYLAERNAGDAVAVLQGKLKVRIKKFFPCLFYFILFCFVLFCFVLFCFLICEFVVCHLGPPLLGSGIRPPDHLCDKSLRHFCFVFF